MKKINQTVDAQEESTKVSYKQAYAKELVAEFLIANGWNVFTNVNPPESAFSQMLTMRGNLRPSFINVVVRNKNKVPESQALPEEIHLKIIEIKKNTTYTVYTLFIDELCGDVYGLNGICPPDFVRGKFKSVEAFWELKNMKFMFKLPEDKRKYLRSLE